MQISQKDKLIIGSLVVILLVGIGFAIITVVHTSKKGFNSKDKDTTSLVKDSSTEGEFSVATVSLNSVDNNVSTTATTSNKQSLPSSTYGRFAYKSSASILSNNQKGTVTIGASQNDPKTETVSFYPDTKTINPETEIKNSANYTDNGEQSFGNNTFNVYQSNQDGSVVYITSNDSRAIVIVIPPTNDSGIASSYVDLSSINFLLSET